MRSATVADAPVTVADQPVTTIMSRPVVAIHDMDTLDRGLQVFAIADLHHLAVVDAEGRYAGLLSDRTVAAAWLHYPMKFSRLRAADVVALTPEPVIAVEAAVRDAALAMHTCGTDAVVVLDADRRPVGVLTAADLVDLIAASDAVPSRSSDEDGDHADDRTWD